ncbi:glycosyltransferase family 2 protein [Lacinutrix sp. MEBiC02404]
MTAEPLVSIIIPTYNRALFIGETLDSVLAQSYLNWECIVVDDGSTDATIEYVQTFVNKNKRFNFYQRPLEKKKGANACRNYGFEKSKGEFIIFLDSDDLLESTCIENRVKSLSSNSQITNEIPVFSMGIYEHQNKTEKIFNKDFDTIKAYLINFMIGNTPWTITCPFWRRDVFNELGGFDEDFKRLQDVDLHTRLLLKGYKIKRIAYTDSWYRVLNNYTDYVSPEKLPVIINAHIMYINKIYICFMLHEELISFKEIDRYLRMLYIRVLSKYVFIDDIYCFKNVWQLNSKRKFIKGLKKLGLLFLCYYHKLNISPNFGYHKLRKFVFN